MVLKGLKLALGFSDSHNGKKQRTAVLGSDFLPLPRISTCDQHFRSRSIQLQGSDDDMTIITVTQDHYSSAQESGKSESGREPEPEPQSIQEEENGNENETRERQLQIERLRNILKFQVQVTSNEATAKSWKTETGHGKRVEAMEQRLCRIEELQRERGVLQMKCDELQMHYDRTQEELRVRRYAAAQQVRKTKS